jgi:hypothetical protein
MKRAMTEFSSLLETRVSSFSPWGWCLAILKGASCGLVDLMALECWNDIVRPTSKQEYLFSNVSRDQSEGFFGEELTSDGHEGGGVVLSIRRELFRDCRGLSLNEAAIGRSALPSKYWCPTEFPVTHCVYIQSTCSFRTA